MPVNTRLVAVYVGAVICCFCIGCKKRLPKPDAIAYYSSQPVQKQIVFPVIVKQNKLPDNFVPAKWHLRNSASDDLNADGLKDVVMVIESNKEFVSDSNGRWNSLPFYPKMLVILLQQKDSSYLLSASATCLFRDYNWGVQGQDPLDTLVIQKGRISISFLTGGFIRDHLSYIFELQNGNWHLTGIDRYQYYLQDKGQSRAYANYDFVAGVKEAYHYSYVTHKKSDVERLRVNKASIKLADVCNDYDLPIDDEE